jgi:hypothetical protein
MAERYEPPQYNPDDPSYQENFVYENNEGKNFGDDGTTPPNNDQTQSSASDNVQANLTALRGDYGQGSEPVNDPQSRYDDFKSQQLQCDYGQNTDALNPSDANYERDDMGENKY